MCLSPGDVQEQDLMLGLIEKTCVGCATTRAVLKQSAAEKALQAKLADLKACLQQSRKKIIDRAETTRTHQITHNNSYLKLIAFKPPYLEERIKLLRGKNKTTSRDIETSRFG